jgi:L-alanine-DL-glutamate epimerase-like enolase superfamily enzyme
MRISAVETTSWTLALRSPFVIAARTAYEASNLRVTVRTEDDHLIGLGESAPVGYVTGESVESVLAAWETVGLALVGQSVERLGPLLTLVSEHLPDAPAARAGLEMALYDVWARHWKIPLWQHFGGQSETLTTDLTIPIVTPDQARALTEEAWADGVRHFKIKVGDPQGIQADLARVAAIAEAAPQSGLRVDANQGFAPDEAVRFAQALAKLAVVELLEQPVAKDDIAGLKYVRQHAGMPVFADESARDVPSVLRLLREDAVDGINVKLMKSGLVGAQQIIGLCQAAGKSLMLGCMLESPLGITAAAALAGGTGAFEFLDLDSPRLLQPVPGLSGGATENGGQIGLNNSTPGWGVTFAGA